MDIISRIKLFMEIEGLSSSQFADAAGIPRPTLSQLLNGRNKNGDGSRKISSDLIRKIHDAFPHLNILWLLFGDGQMVIGRNSEFSDDQNPDFFMDYQTKQPGNDSIQQQIDFQDCISNLSSEKKSSAIQDDFSDSSTSKKQMQGVSQYDDDDVARASSQVAGHIPNNQQTEIEKPKYIESIMVFYSDKSFEVYKSMSDLNAH